MRLFLQTNLQNEALPGGSHVAHLNFKTSRVGVLNAVTIWPREVVSCCDFILRAVAIFWAMSLVRIYPGRASKMGIKPLNHQ